MTTDVNRPGANDAVRWAEAQALATGATAGVRRSRGWRTPSRRRILLGVVVAAVAGVVGGVAFAGHPAHSDGSGVAGWREALGIVLFLVGLGLAMVTFVRAHRTGIWSWSSPMQVLSVRQRRQARRQLRGRAPVAEHEVEVLRAAAHVFLVQSRNSWPVLLGLGLIDMGQLLRSDSAVLTGLWVVALGFLVVGALQLVREGRRMQGFFDEHPAPKPVGGV